MPILYARAMGERSGGVEIPDCRRKQVKLRECRVFRVKGRMGQWGNGAMEQWGNGADYAGCNDSIGEAGSVK